MALASCKWRKLQQPELALVSDMSPSWKSSPEVNLCIRIFCIRRKSLERLLSFLLRKGVKNKCLYRNQTLQFEPKERGQIQYVFQCLRTCLLAKHLKRTKPNYVNSSKRLHHDQSTSVCDAFLPLNYVFCMLEKISIQRQQAPAEFSRARTSQGLDFFDKYSTFSLFFIV